jgi:TonB family protein
MMRRPTSNIQPSAELADRRAPVRAAVGLNFGVISDDGLNMQPMVRSVARSVARSFFVAALTGVGLAAAMGTAHSAAGVVSPGTVLGTVGEPTIATPGASGDYLRKVHDRLHGHWTDTFVKTVAATYPASHALNNPSLQATVALAIRWDGTIAEATIKRSSGSSEFDRASVDATRKGAPYPLPTPDVISDDSYCHIEWTFARDHRACGAGAVISRVDDPLAVSLPRLIRNNRVGEALRRVGELPKETSDAGLDRFAKLYLSRTVPDPVLNIAASVVLAELGDRSQAARLREAVASRPTMEMAVRGLQKLGVDVCDTVHEALNGGMALARENAIAAMRAGGSIGAEGSRCQTTLAQMVSDSRQATALRLLALDTLVSLAPTSARPIVMAAMLEKDPAVRGAAILASVRKGAGRPEMYRLAPLLHDKVLEVRGAASAGMVRAAGDMALDQLYLLARETDPRPGQLVAAELAKMTTTPSAEFLGRMLRKENFHVQIAAARALAARNDAAALIELDGIKADAAVPAEVRAIAAAKGKPTLAVGQDQAAAAFSAATQPVHRLLKENRNRDAAVWIIEKFQSLEPRDGIDVLGAWLLRSQPAAVQTKPAGPPSAPATAAPASGSPTTSAFAM